MKVNVKFPSKAGLLKPSMLQRYYKVYYGFVLESLKHIDAEIELVGDTAIDDAKYTIEFNGKQIAIDYSDHLQLARTHADYDYYFKFHCSEGEHEQFDHVYAFSPISFYDWRQYFQLSKSIEYKAVGNTIINRQKPHGNALQRRRQVRSLLAKQYGDEAMLQPIDQVGFWEEVGDCLVSVCVPGSRNNMLDRGQLQYMGLGCCTISPYLITTLPYGNKLIPGVHYIACKDDYSDLVDKVEWCKNNRNACVEIGRNAKALFAATCIPQKLWEWVQLVVSGKEVVA